VSGVISPERIAAALGSKHIMLVLDNCEHVIEAAAGMVEALLHANPRARVIATVPSAEAPSSKTLAPPSGSCFFQL
jgi:predicted ATPase